MGKQIVISNSVNHFCQKFGKEWERERKDNDEKKIPLHYCGLGGVIIMKNSSFRLAVCASKNYRVRCVHETFVCVCVGGGGGAGSIAT